jgi:hypothetical protein
MGEPILNNTSPCFFLVRKFWHLERLLKVRLEFDKNETALCAFIEMYRSVSALGL